MLELSSGSFNWTKLMPRPRSKRFNSQARRFSRTLRVLFFYGKLCFLLFRRITKQRSIWHTDSTTDLQMRNDRWEGNPRERSSWNRTNPLEWCHRMVRETRHAFGWSHRHFWLRFIKRYQSTRSWTYCSLCRQHRVNASRSNLFKWVY